MTDEKINMGVQLGGFDKWGVPIPETIIGFEGSLVPYGGSGDNADNPIADEGETFKT